MAYNSPHKSKERRARNSAGAEALAVARRPEEASREKTTVSVVTTTPLVSKSYKLTTPRLIVVGGLS